MTRVVIDFVWCGYVGRETYEVELIPARPDVTALTLACRAFEYDLIECGAEAWECGCCVNPEHVHMLRYTVCT